MPVVAVGTFDVVNADAAAFADADVFVDDCAFDDCAAPYPDIGDAGFGVLGFLQFGFVVVGAHADYAVEAGACFD